MNFDDLKDKLAGDAQMTWERIQESGAYNQLRDRYENMSPTMQKVTVFGAMGLFAFLILSIPYSYYSHSRDSVAEFEGQRMTIRELLKVSRESSDVPQIPQAPSMEMLRTTVEGQLRAASLLPEQIKGLEVLENSSQMVPQNLTEGVLQITLNKLNLHQILDLGHGFQSVNPSVKLKDFSMNANREDARYFDVVFKLVALAVPAPPEEVAPENSGRGGGVRERFKSRNNNGEGGEE